VPRSAVLHSHHRQPAQSLTQVDTRRMSEPCACTSGSLLPYMTPARAAPSTGPKQIHRATRTRVMVVKARAALGL
jgi:hypothetical protein